MRYFFGFLVTIALIVFILVLVFSGGGSKSPTKPINLPDYANTDARAQILIDGPEVSEQDHRVIEIDVTRDQVSFTLLKGYQRTLLNTKSYPNNAKAFETFLYGLQRSGYATGVTDKTTGDERGYCVAGSRDIYTFNDGSKNLFRYWSTTCNQGTFKGNVATVSYLFKNQVPDYDQLIAGLDF